MDELAYVVILNWNGESYVRDCLRSVLGQTYPRYRVLVVDNGSTDRSRDIIRAEFPEVNLLALPENRHFARGSNAGIREALKDPACAYVVTLNNDTRVEPMWLSELVRPAKEGTDMVACKLVFMDRPQFINSTGLCVAPDGSGMDRGWNQRDEGQFEEALDVFGPSAGAALYRRDLLEAVGLFDEDFVAYYEDLDLAWRARLVGRRAAFAPHAVVHHKFSGSFGKGSFLKTYLCERNRIWNLIHNYPWRYVPFAIPWNSARVLAGPMPWDGSKGARVNAAGNRPGQTAAAMARARIDGYAGIPRALEKRRRRETMSRVSTSTVGDWLRMYRVSLRDSVLA